MRRVALLLALAALGPGCSEETPPPSPPPDVQGELLDAPLEPRVAEEVSRLGDLDSGPPAPAPSSEDDLATRITFAQLGGFAFEPPPWDEAAEDPGAGAEAATRDQLPAELRELVGERVALEGYMHPLEYEDAFVRRFIVVSDPAGCCFGVAPPLNGYVEVTVTGPEGVPYHIYTVIEVRGDLAVRSARHPRGYLQGIYTMEVAREDFRIAEAR